MKFCPVLENEESGVTLVELLVVVVIIGILAVAVFAALDPLEQIWRSEDMAKVTVSRELVSAYERYYGVYREYPWSSGAAPSGQQITTDTWDDSNVGGNYLVSAEELKVSFPKRPPIAKGQLYLSEDSEKRPRVCFNPRSKAYLSKAECDQDATGCSTDCNEKTQDCYYCVPGSPE